MRAALRRMVDEPASRTGRAFALGVQAMIVLSLVAFCVETLPGLSPEWKTALEVFELTTVALFTLEYILRLAFSARPLAYATSVFGIIDLLAILPFYVARGLDLRAIRVVRLLRLVRVLKLVRYSRAVRRYRMALRESREELLLFGAVTLILLFLASVGIYYCEREAQPDVFRSMFDAMWWSVVTLTTVGYGDAFPVTAGGRFLTFIMLMIGLGVVAIPPAVLAAALTKVREEDGLADERKEHP